MQKILILSRKKAVRLSYQDMSIDRIIISISDLDKTHPRFNENNFSIKGILYLYFDDVLNGEPGAMTSNDAEKILNFIKHYYDACEQIVVQCEAGISRSAGVAAGICELLNIDNSYIFASEEYVPNKHCYQKIKDKMEELKK